MPTDICVRLSALGTHLLQNCSPAVVFASDPESPTIRSIQGPRPDVHLQAILQALWADRYFKSHACRKNTAASSTCCAMAGRPWFPTITATGEVGDRFLVLRAGEGVRPCAWHEHVRTLAANPYHADMIASIRGLASIHGGASCADFAHRWCCADDRLPGAHRAPGGVHEGATKDVPGLGQSGLARRSAFIRRGRSAAIATDAPAGVAFPWKKGWCNAGAFRVTLD